MLKRFGRRDNMETNYEVIYLGYGEVDFIKEEDWSILKERFLKIDILSNE